MALQITLSEEKDIVIIQMAGRIDSFVIDELNTGFDRAMKTGKKNILLLLRDLEYINSRGIGSLMSFFKWVKKAGGLVKIAEVPLNIMQVLNLLGLDGLTLMYDSKSDAMESFGRGQPVEAVSKDEAPAGHPPATLPPQKGARVPYLFLGIGCVVLLGLVFFLLVSRPTNSASVDLAPVQARLERLEHRLGQLEGQDRDKPDVAGQIQVLGTDLKGRMETLEKLVDQLGTDLAAMHKRRYQKPATSPTGKKEPRYHMVRNGESLYRIGRKYSISIRELCGLNNISSSKVIHPGQKLIVGFSPTPPTPAQTSQ
ncbi:MAG: LysM peptidoglycan-binding domain-containing protein [Deltaproteobacteria bacterium]|nr:LysM peptidoglycan-binding domain-containing protein [Deltaproteobacteria bacterium]